jgi:aminoglycoside phosphotransferase family enzyme/predicted kinase
MLQSNLYELLKNPSVYGKENSSVNIIQTHISFVVLTDLYAYKIKKPVNFGFLDFSTLEKRKHFCEEEIRLNKRLCPDIYLDVVTLNLQDKSLKINGPGKIVDYAVKMKQFPQSNIMTNLLKKQKVTREIIKDLILKLVKFYEKSKIIDENNQYGSIKVIKKNTDENFIQTQDMIGITITEETYNYIRNSTNNFLEKMSNQFHKRIKKGFICECHGDLHSGNIVIDKKIYIFDCIEFNKRFRNIDIASDIGFLAMDLDIQSYPYLSSYLIEKYIQKSKDQDILKILNFYKCYRAYVRGKVIGFKLNDVNTERSEKDKIKNTAKKYFRLAEYYAKIISLQIKEKEGPLLFITTGLTGTGKSTIARKISFDYNAEILSTDMLRKEIEDIDLYERHHEPYNKGLYSPEKMRNVYEKLLKKSDLYLKNNKNIILDGTFRNEELRSKAKKIGEKNNAIILLIYCNCPEKIVRQYLNKRIEKKSISDGRWEIYIKQKDTYQKPDIKDNVIEIDISNKSFEYQIKIFNKIYRYIKENSLQV